MRNPFKHPESKLHSLTLRVIAFLIVLALLSVVLDTIQNLPPLLVSLLRGLDVVILVVFTIEYLMRIQASENKIRYCLSFFGITDLLAILPFYLGLAIDLRSLRAFRLLRLLALIKFSRYGTAAIRLRNAVTSVSNEITAFLFLAAIVIYVCGVGIFYLEHASQPEKFRNALDGFWWALATMTTVGYGDIYPVTAGGKIFTGIILLVGLGIVAVPTGLISAALTAQRQAKNDN